MYSFPYIILFMISLSHLFIHFQKLLHKCIIVFFQIGSQCFCGNLIKTHLRVCLIVNVINPATETLRKRVVQVGEQKYICIYIYSFETRSKPNKSKMQHHDFAVLFRMLCKKICLCKSVHKNISCRLAQCGNYPNCIVSIQHWQHFEMLDSSLSFACYEHQERCKKKCIVNTMLSGHFNNLEVYTWKMKQIVNRILKRYSIYVKDSQ